MIWKKKKSVIKLNNPEKHFGDKRLEVENFKYTLVMTGNAPLEFIGDFSNLDCWMLDNVLLRYDSSFFDFKTNLNLYVVELDKLSLSVFRLKAMCDFNRFSFKVNKEGLVEISSNFSLVEFIDCWKEFDWKEFGCNA